MHHCISFIFQRGISPTGSSFVRDRAEISLEKKVLPGWARFSSSRSTSRQKKDQKEKMIIFYLVFDRRLMLRASLFHATSLVRHRAITAVMRMGGGCFIHGSRAAPPLHCHRTLHVLTKKNGDCRHHYWRDHGVAQLGIQKACTRDGVIVSYRG